MIVKNIVQYACEGIKLNIKSHLLLTPLLQKTLRPTLNFK